MILKNIFGKTIEAARRTAQQMYGDDILILEAAAPTKDGGQARITVFTDEEPALTSSQPTTVPSFSNAMKEQEQGVIFERTTAPTSIKEPSESTKLKSLRKFAKDQILAEHDRKSSARSIEQVEGRSQNLPTHSINEENTSSGMYTRSHSRSFLSQTPTQDDLPENSELRTVSSKKEKKFITHFKETKPAEESEEVTSSSSSTRKEKIEVSALHKRFDKLEALLDSALISANLDYASHPVFQQLVQTGINSSVVASWFSEIIKEGVDPFDQAELFMAKIAGLIRDAIGKVSNREPQKYMLFAGPSGSGKTSMIMKLCSHPDFMLGDNIAVVSVRPQSDSDQAYYTILEPFCRDKEIPFYDVQHGLDITEKISELNQFDHILIDTPSLSMENEDSFRHYWKIRQILTPLTPLEVHFVVNAARNRFYFRDNSAKNHPLQPDYVSITHLDEVSQWGPIIPFIKEMDCSARYISMGNELPASLSEFNPKWIAQRVLREN